MADLVVQVVEADPVVVVVAEVAVVVLAQEQPSAFVAAALDCVAALDWQILAAVVVVVVVLAAAAAATVVAVVPSCVDLVDPFGDWHQPFVVVEETSSFEDYPFRQILVLEQVVDSIVFGLLLEPSEQRQELLESVEAQVFQHDCSSGQDSCPVVDLVAIPALPDVVVAAVVLEAAEVAIAWCDLVVQQQ